MTTKAEWQRERLKQERERPPVIPCRDVAAARWDPANPIKYNFDRHDYNPADYLAFKQARAAFMKQRPGASFDQLTIKSRVNGDKVTVSSPWYSRIFRVGK